MEPDTPARPERRRFRLSDAGFFTIVAAVGIASGLAACVFRTLVLALTALAFGAHGEDVLVAAGQTGWAWRILIPTVGGFLAGAVGWIAARQRGGHGIPEIMEAVTLKRGVVSLTATATKAAAGLFAIASGGSVGREGPIVSLGSAIGSRLGRLVGYPDRRVRVLAAAGCAGGLAAAYDAPIGAVIFVVEIVAGSFALDLLLPVVAASTFATAVTRAWFGSEPLFRVPAFAIVSAADAAAHAFLGLLAGGLGHLFLRMLGAGERFFARLALPRPVAGALGGLGVGLLGVFTPQVFGNGFEATSRILDGSFTVAGLGLILVAKMAATTLTVSSGAPGGVFTPTLLLGASLGGLVGSLVHATVAADAGPPGGYALVGMAAVLAATTHAPVLSSVIVFEMSGDYAIVLPLFLATSIAVGVSRSLSSHSVYTRELSRRGLVWEGSIEERLAREVRARDLVRDDAIVVPPETPFGELRRLFAETRARTVFVGDDRGVQGIVDLHFMKRHLDERLLDTTVVAADIVAATPTASPDDTLLDLSHKIHVLDFGELPVVDPGPPARVLGVVTRRDLLAAFDREILKRDLLVTRIVWREGDRLASELLELPPGARIAEIRVPAELAGRALRDAKMREQKGVNVIAVVRGGGSRHDERCQLPTPDLVLERGDRLVVIVPQRPRESRPLDAA
jgi:CIC family chloride channel protein